MAGSACLFMGDFGDEDRQKPGRGLVSADEQEAENLPSVGLSADRSLAWRDKYATFIGNYQKQLTLLGMTPDVKNYLSQIGRRGGKASRRRLDAETARAMTRVRESRRAFRRSHTRCFWSYDPNYRVQANDIPWVAQRLMEYGGREGWELGARLCR